MCLRQTEVLLFVGTEGKAAKSFMQAMSGGHVSQYGFALRHTWDRVRPLVSTSCVGASYPTFWWLNFLICKGGRCFSQVAVGIICYRDLEMLDESRKPSINETNTGINHDNATSPVIRIENHILAAFWVGGSRQTSSYCYTDPQSNIVHGEEEAEWQAKRPSTLTCVQSLGPRKSHLPQSTSHRPFPRKPICKTQGLNSQNARCGLKIGLRKIQISFSLAFGFSHLATAWGLDLANQ